MFICIVTKLQLGEKKRVHSLTFGSMLGYVVKLSVGLGHVEHKLVALCCERQWFLLSEQIFLKCIA